MKDKRYINRSKRQQNNSNYLLVTKQKKQEKIYKNYLNKIANKKKYKNQSMTLKLKKIKLKKYSITY